MEERYMASLFSGTPKIDTSAQDAAEKAAKAKEAQLANELAARRRAGGSSGQSKTIFSAVEGIGQATAKKTKLGGE